MCKGVVEKLRGMAVRVSTGGNRNHGEGTVENPCSERTGQCKFERCVVRKPVERRCVFVNFVKVWYWRESESWGRYGRE